MRTHGTIVRWNDERGFGFVRPAGQRHDVFVHISELGKTGRPPQVGELISFDIQHHDGKPRAVNVRRTATMAGITAPSTRPEKPERRGSLPIVQWLIYAAIALIAVSWARPHWGTLTQWLPLARHSAPAAAPRATAKPASSAAYECAGRIHCSQMRSCAEAKFFLAHCPGVKMDGNGDGVPCEAQWCGH